METFHRSNYGQFGGRFMADLDGFVALQADEVMTQSWPHSMTFEQAEEIAEHNRSAKEYADDRLAVWREVA